MFARPRRTCSSVSFALAVLIVLVASLAPRCAQAQAQSTAVKRLGLSVFGAVTALDPKYGITTRELGYTAGGDLTYHLRLLDISFEARYTSATGFSADESTYGGGFKFERAFGRFHPYLDLLAESGKVKFDHPEIYGDPSYTHDNSFVYDLGAGVDYDLTRSFALKAEVQGQRWQIGAERPAFNPYNGSVGVVYRIPFRELRHR